MELVNENNYHLITIEWSRPRPLDAFFRRPKDENSYFYTLLIRSPRGRQRLAYIGMVWEQNVSHRLVGHSVVPLIKKENPRSSILVSKGTPSIKKGNLTYERVNDAESLLIYSHKPLYNTQNISWLNVTGHLYIENTRYLRDHIRREIAYGPIFP